jgi:hypothetical protein
MSGKEWEEIKEMSFEDVLQLFVDGMMENRVRRLQSFCNVMGIENA